MNTQAFRLVRASLLLLLLCGLGEAAVPQTRLFVTNNLTNNSPGGRLLEFDGTTGEFVGLVANIDTPRGVAVGPDGDLYVASTTGHRVLKFSLGSGMLQSNFVAPGVGGLEFPWALTFGPDGHLYVTSGIRPITVLRYDGTTGEFLDLFATDPLGASPATDMKFGPNGNLYVATLSHGVFQFDAQSGASLGNIIPPNHFRFAASIAFGPDHNLYVATGPDNSVLRFSGSTGDFIGTFVDTRLNDAQGIGFGPDGNFYVAGLFNDSILRYDGQSGAFINVFAFSRIDAPMYFVFFVPEPDCLALMLLTVLTFGCRPLGTRRHVVMPLCWNDCNR